MNWNAEMRNEKKKSLTKNNVKETASTIWTFNLFGLFFRLFVWILIWIFLFSLAVNRFVQVQMCFVWFYLHLLHIKFKWEGECYLSLAIIISQKYMRTFFVPFIYLYHGKKIALDMEIVNICVQKQMNAMRIERVEYSWCHCEHYSSSFKC